MLDAAVWPRLFLARILLPAATVAVVTAPSAAVALDAPPADSSQPEVVLGPFQPVDARVPDVMAEVAGLELLLPQSDPLAVGFHEARSASALSLSPSRGRTLPSRSRGTDATSAVDVAVAPDTPLVAPVTGEVIQASSYALYGQTHDELVLIAPDDNPDVAVKVLHLDGLRVETGQRVVAGETVIADRSRLLPFPSQIDEWAGGRVRHAHITVVPW
jgi:murein DD-endopeptidase MepM/ murein hydrolase activator NlpD